MSEVAVSEAAADADVLRMRVAMGQLQARCEQQEKEIAVLRQQANAHGNSDLRAGYCGDATQGMAPIARSSVSVDSQVTAADIRPIATSHDQCCQTEERMFLEQLDLVHREAAQKGKELRKLQETMRLLRDELRQEKVVAEQYQGQVEGLENQLRDAMIKQHRAEGERSLAEWHLNGAKGNGRSRSGTPQSGMSRGLMNAWAEPGRTSRGGIAEDGELTAPGSSSQTCDRQRRGDGKRRQLSDESAGEESAGEESVTSEGSEAIEVYHPPPSRGGVRR